MMPARWSPEAGEGDAPRRLSLHAAGTPGRDEVEAFVHEVYGRRYGARVPAFAPMLAGLRDDDGTLVAAAGWRPAGDGTLYLERYLDAPVEQVLARQVGTPPSRSAIFEVGHLAATRSGEGRRLIHALGPVLARAGCGWVVSTLTESLRQLFVRLGVTPLALGVADPAMLGDEAQAWGRYYDHQPVVLAGHLPAALRRLARRGA